MSLLNDEDTEESSLNRRSMRVADIMQVFAVVNAVLGSLLTMMVAVISVALGAVPGLLVAVAIAAHTALAWALFTLGSVVAEHIAERN